VPTRGFTLRIYRLDYKLLASYLLALAALIVTLVVLAALTALTGVVCLGLGASNDLLNRR
jgi:hypothetical protein